MPIDIINKVDCCGCNACGDVCPTGAISFNNDIEGFWYPEVDSNKCIGCDLCVKTCPIININRLKTNDYPNPKEAIAAVNKNMAVRIDSTSGGLFSVFAEFFYKKGGYVGGAVYDETFKVKEFISNDPADLEKLRSSKYLESYAEGFYKKIKKLLIAGEKVVVCGTPCQMAGLRAFLGKEYEKLLVIDFVCRGVNSPKVYRKYLDYLESEYDSKIVKIKAKNKDLGWRNLTRKVTFENGNSYYGILMDDDFRRGYHTNVYCRPSCYRCLFKDFPRMSDITLGDFWGIERFNRNLDNNMGTSLVLLNSKKGEAFFEKIKDKIEYEAYPLESVFEGNVAFFSSLEKPVIDRNLFFKSLDENGFAYVRDKFFPKNKPIAKISPLKRKLKKVRNCLGFARRLYSLFGLSFMSYYNFYKLNWRKQTKRIERGQLIYPMPGSVYDIADSAKIEIGMPLKFGAIPVKGMRMPSCLKMADGTSLVIHNGPIDRYGDSDYSLKYGAYIEIVNNGKLTIGRGACNVGLTIMCAYSITIGNSVRIGRNVSIRDWNGPHVIISDAYRNHAPVVIEDNVWLCTGCTIMPGVRIGKGSVVASNSVVTKDVPENCLVAGVPAKVIKKDIKWL